MIDIVEKRGERMNISDLIKNIDELIKIKKYDDALNIIKSSLEENIFEPFLYRLMGQIYERKLDYDRAYLCYEQYINLADNHKEEDILEKLIDWKESRKVTVNNYSIVILTYNNLEYTKVCLESIEKYNKFKNYEIIIIDNNSSDGTKEFLKNTDDIKYIINKENNGFPKGCNQGIEIAERNNDIFLLNNDTIVMPNSIFNLRMGLYSNKNIGATGSTSNYVSYYQQINERFNSIEEYIEFALKNNITDENMYEDRLKLVGFAMMIKREVIDSTGKLDERFSPGNFEDDDYSLRIISNGYRLLLCKDSFILHFGSVSFNKNPNLYNDLLNRNYKKFFEKWGIKSEDLFINYNILSRIEEKSNMNILQLGCACGATLLQLKNINNNYSVYGIENNLNCLKIADKVVNASEKEDDLLSNMKNEYYDYIVFDRNYSYDKSLKYYVEKCIKCLKIGGKILIEVMSNNFEQDNCLTPSNIKTELESQGFENVNLIEVTTNDSKQTNYLVEGIINNKEKCISERQLVFILRRLEFDIDIDENIHNIITLVNKQLIDEEKLIKLIDMNIINKIKVVNLLTVKFFENQVYDVIIPLLVYAYNIDKNNVDTVYNLAYILNAFGESKSALYYLNSFTGLDDSIEELKKSIGEQNYE